MGREAALRSLEQRSDFNSWFSSVFGEAFPVQELNLKYLANQGYTWGSSEIFRSNLWWLKWNSSNKNYLNLNLSSVKTDGIGLISFDREGGSFVYISPNFFLKLVYKSEGQFPPFVFADHFLEQLRECVALARLAVKNSQGIFFEKKIQVTKERKITNEALAWGVWNYAGSRMVLGKNGIDPEISKRALHGFLNQDLSAIDAGNSAVKILPLRCTIYEWMNYRECDQIPDFLLKPTFVKPLKKMAYTDPNKKIAEQRLMLAQVGEEYLVWNEPRLRSGGLEYAYSDLKKRAHKFKSLQEAETRFAELPKNLNITPIFDIQDTGIETETESFRKWYEVSCETEFPFYIPDNLARREKDGVVCWHNLEAFERRPTSTFVYGHDVQTAIFPDVALFEFIESSGYLHLLVKYGLFCLGYRSMSIASNIDSPILKRFGKDLIVLKEMVAAYYKDGLVINISIDMERTFISCEDERQKSFVYGSADHNLKSLHAVVLGALSGHRRVKTGGAYAIRTEKALPYESWIRHVEQTISDTPTKEWELTK